MRMIKPDNSLLFQAVDQLIHALSGYFLVIIEIHLQTGGKVAVSKTLNLLKSELPIGRGPANLTAELVTDMLGDLFGALEHARKRPAYLQFVFAYGLAGIHAVEGDNLFNLVDPHIESFSQVPDVIVRHVSVFVLRNEERRENGRPLDRIMRDNFIELLFV